MENGALEVRIETSPAATDAIVRILDRNGFRADTDYAVLYRGRYVLAGVVLRGDGIPTALYDVFGTGTVSENVEIRRDGETVARIVSTGDPSDFAVEIPREDGGEGFPGFSSASAAFRFYRDEYVPATEEAPILPETPETDGAVPPAAYVRGSVVPKPGPSPANPDYRKETREAPSETVRILGEDSVRRGLVAAETVLRETEARAEGAAEEAREIVRRIEVLEAAARDARNRARRAERGARELRETVREYREALSR